MKFQVDEAEYMALLQLKSTVDIVVKLWDSGKEFATPDSMDVLFAALRKEVGKIPPQQTPEAIEDFI